ncbi:hypothetical protein A2U01_0103519, partial [Trifolium medium]|nr:hypothetical protein [Trifolium medium]
MMFASSTKYSLPSPSVFTKEDDEEQIGAETVKPKFPPSQLPETCFP